MNLLFWASKSAKRTSKRLGVGFGNVGLLMVYLKLLSRWFLFVAKVRIAKLKNEKNTEKYSLFLPVVVN
jgi:hypothetical protein